MAKAFELNNLLRERKVRLGEGNQLLLLCCPNADAVATNPRRLVAPLIDKEKECNRMVVLIRAMQKCLMVGDSKNETGCQIKKRKAAKVISALFEFGHFLSRSRVIESRKNNRSRQVVRNKTVKTIR